MGLPASNVTPCRLVVSVLSRRILGRFAGLFGGFVGIGELLSATGCRDTLVLKESSCAQLL